MRCTSCGLPLSPARTMTSCPRCGQPIVSEKKSALPVAQRPFPETISWEPVAPQIWQPEVERGSMERTGGVRSGSDGFHAAGADVQSDIPFPPASPSAAMYVPQPASLSPSTPAGTRGSAPRNMGSNVQMPQVLEHGEAGRGSVLSDVREQEEVRVLRASPVLTAQYQPWQPGDSIHRPARRSTNNRGFIVAGVCVIMGGLLLVFVYFMAMGLPGSSSGSSTVKTNSASNSLPTTASSPVSSPAATPFPGQKYIDHAQLASSIDPTSHQAIQLTTTFKARQSIYVIFQVHPAGQNGAVCLLWYANNKVFFPYALQVYPNERTTYSFASYGGIGSGYVELYWASTTRCTDKVLAQRVNFTVTT